MGKCDVMVRRVRVIFIYFHVFEKTDITRRDGSYGELMSLAKMTRIFLHVKCPICFTLSEASWEFFGEFHKNPQYQISCKCVGWNA